MFLNKEKLRIVLMLVGIIAISFFAQRITLALADQPYVGVHVDSFAHPVTGESWGAVEYFYAWMNFDGTSPSQVTTHLLSVISTAGWDKGSDTVTGFQYQHIVQAAEDASGTLLVFEDPQVWQGQDLQVWNCEGACESLGSVSNTDFVYYSANWNNAETTIPFYTEVHHHFGAPTAVISTYNRVQSDTSDAFSVGWVPRESPFNDNRFYAKLLQMGVESDEVLTSGWQVNQNGLHYELDYSGASVRTLANDNVVSHDGRGDIAVIYRAGGSTLTWDPSTGNPIDVGGAPYDVGADYDNKPGSSKSPGDISWYPATPNEVNPSTAFWGKGSLIVDAERLGNPLPSHNGLWVVIRDSNLAELKSGYTPIEMTIPQSGTYYVDFSNHGTWYYTRAASDNTFTYDQNANSWGGRIEVDVPDTHGHTLIGRYYNDAEPTGYSKVTTRTEYQSGAELDGIRVVIQLLGNTFAKGYTPYTVGLLADNPHDYIWNNVSGAYYREAITDMSETPGSDIALCWGGNQEVTPLTEGADYTNSGYYATIPLSGC